MRHRRGQTTFEVALFLGAAVLALVGLHLYVQRAYQGYLYSTGAAHGPQFDRSRPYHVEQAFSAFSQTQDITIASSGPAVEQPKGTLGRQLESVPGGPLPQRVIRTDVKATTDWKITRGSTYEAQ